jgi:hypothetical protein
MQRAPFLIYGKIIQYNDIIMPENIIFILIIFIL